MIDTPQIVETAEQQTAIIRIKVPRSEIQHVMGPGIQELMATVAAQGITPTGAWYNHHVRMDPEVFEFELGIPVASPITPAGRVVAGVLPAATLARTVYHGGYEGLGEAWGEFGAWIESAGLTSAPNLWECYLVGPESGPDEAGWQTQLNRPLVK